MRALQRVHAAVTLGNAHRLKVLWQALIMPHRASGVRRQTENRRKTVSMKRKAARSPAPAMSAEMCSSVDGLAGTSGVA